MPFAAALSEHPDAAVAIGEATGQVLDALGDGEVDLALLFASGPHVRALADAAGVVRALLRPAVLLGATASGVLAAGREVEGTASFSLWTGRFGAVHPLRLGPGGRPTEPDFEPAALVLVGDPSTFVAAPHFGDLARQWPGLPIVGGLASAAVRPGGNRLVLDDLVTTAGGVGVLLGPGVEVEALVSQGCRPVGDPLVVTAADGHVVRELGGRPAMARVLELANDRLTPEEVQGVNQGGLLVGRAVDEGKAELERGDFLVGELVGASQVEGWIALTDEVAVGATLQFHLRDADTADDDLRATLNGRAADAALVFAGAGRGRQLFDVPHHDAAVVDEYLGRPAAAGMSCAGAFGPVGGRNVVHGPVASLALVREHPTVRPQNPER